MPKKRNASFWILEQVAIDRRLYPRNLGLTEEEYRTFLWQRSFLDNRAETFCGNKSAVKLLRTGNFAQTIVSLERKHFSREKPKKHESNRTYYKGLVIPFYSKGKYKPYQRNNRDGKSIIPTARSLGYSCNKGFIRLPTNEDFKRLIGKLSPEKLDVLFSLHGNTSFPKWEGVNPNFIYIRYDKNRRRNQPVPIIVSSAMLELLALPENVIADIIRSFLNDDKVITTKYVLLQRRSSKSISKYSENKYRDVIMTFASPSQAKEYVAKENEEVAMIIIPRYAIGNIESSFDHLL